MNRALIFAGGTGQRMGDSSVPKQFLAVHSKPIIVHTIEHFQKSSLIDSIVVVCLEDYISYLNGLIKTYRLDKVVSVVGGGRCGQESIFNGLKELVRLYGENSKDIVLINDGVRPLISEKLIADNIACVEKNGNAVTVAKAVETVVLVNGDTVDKVMDRSVCNMAKAPQSFYLDEIYRNHLKARGEGRNDFIDSATLMQYYGCRLHTVISSGVNIKITTPMDYYLFRAILEADENEQLKLL